MGALHRVYVSVLGSQLLTQALLFYIPVYVYRATGHAGDLGIVFFAEWLPAIAIFPFAGRWIRGLDPGTVLRLVLLARVVLLAGLGAAGLGARVPPAAMVAGLLCFSVTMAFYRLATEVLSVRQFVADAAAAQARIQTTDILAFVLGPFLGGLFVDWLTLPAMFGLGALALLALHALVDRLRPPAPATPPAAQVTDFGVLAALRFIFGHPTLRAHALLNFSINMVTGFVLTMSVPLVVRVFYHPEAHAAFANAAGAIGSALVVSWLARSSHFKTRSTLFGALFFVLFLLSAARAATAGSFLLYAASIVVFQASIQGHNLYHRIERLKHIPSDRFAQVLSALYLSFLLPLPLCGLVVRLLDGRAPYAQVILGAVAAAAACGAACYLSIFRREREGYVHAIT